MGFGCYYAIVVARFQNSEQELAFDVSFEFLFISSPSSISAADGPIGEKPSQGRVRGYQGRDGRADGGTHRNFPREVRYVFLILSFSLI